MYFFSPRDRKYPNGKLPSRITGEGDGLWKATGKDLEIFSQKWKAIGARKTLVFYDLKSKHGAKKTNWIMHEYTIDENISPSTSTTRAPGDNRLDDWVLCKVYPSKMSKPKPNTGDGGKTEMIDSEPLEQDLPVLESPATPNLGEQVNVSNESVQALYNGVMTVPYGSTTGYVSQEVTNLGARSLAHHQQNLSLLPSFSQLPVINNVSSAISSLAGGDNNNGTITTPNDGSNGSEKVINLHKNLHADHQQDLPSLQNSSKPSVINSVGSAIASLAGSPVFPDFQQVPRGFGAQFGTNIAPITGIQAHQSPHGIGPLQSRPSLDNGCLPPLPQCYYYYDDRGYSSF
ncbi:NAC domain-containing protein JA2L-like [Rosa rugosa]|uniref:NAC domain-containing protein JA2L-like n=1 Tax=Rosa rugosa TaxID=74645 RepID=UPI002B401B60|nr:NAC domain-containing protein JA2L-like [Rosa rugosa]